MRLTCLLLALLLTAGCATALKRDAQCLATLTPDYLDARHEADRLQDAWHDALAEAERAPGPVRWRSAPAAAGEHPAAIFLATALSRPRVIESGDLRQAARQAVEDARERFLAARRRLVQTGEWYDRVYRRVHMRIEERQILMESFMVLAGGGVGALAFYPVVWWNVHTVFWEGVDPDRKGDPVTRYCRERLEGVDDKDMTDRGSGSDAESPDGLVTEPGASFQ